MFFRDGIVLNADLFVQMCCPGIEYPKSNAPKTLRFAGDIPPGLRDSVEAFPTWCDDIAINYESKTIVLVSQSTLHNQPTNRPILPTMLAFKDHKNVIVVVALGQKGTTLPEEWQSKYLDVFVMNAGYGSIQHALSQGTLMVVASTEADQAENSARVEWVGAGVNLCTNTLTQETLQSAVAEVLENPKYKRRVQEIQGEMQTYDLLGTLMEAIEELVNRV
ncbi:UDP-Glycosyltransferase/glycogen phosphorylase [Acephala macrosclerotiorum]|nr:UDP-Glycosyltransferase/glycogen phosphorylase [Acephala macrosclerotiorum]